MKIRRFVAPDMRQAMRQVRDEQGPDAVILSTRRLDDGIEIINFGPGSGAQGHAANESVPIAAMVEAAKIQLDVIGRLLM